ncbi:TadE/TadG family type IV pilus assembly protein [Sinorhizobium alkalisoli]|uniref:Pilus assembly protein TadE n=1 Tax=Sinorhizobium alkalisoli TaxID=1752398 RepID=A0A1E3VAB3_9HYPH|nr:TadE/TadG family type IV pilus assembly protein [Sinorhizobium alkalisoli]MCG5481027.1 pilus assembly protein [Sinorhizobium alkalisoli]ODR90425.1 pilus assembly protein TadE [Sinorhizobium alkalisoli]
MNWLRCFFNRRWRFWSTDDGAVLAEALIVVPFVTVFAAGILEFGNIFWERMQIDAGLRDAGRYLARCRPTSPTYTSTCSQATAKMIAFYGTQTPSTGTALRVPGWGPTLADITVNPVGAGGTFTIETAHLYEASPLFGWLGIDAITISVSHEERYMGW